MTSKASKPFLVLAFAFVATGSVHAQLAERVERAAPATLPRFERMSGRILTAVVV